MSNNFNKGNTTRLTNDKYVRPVKTKQDMYTPEEINNMLEDYEPIEDINEVALGSHLRYFATVLEGKKKVKKFRRGGMLSKNDPKEPFVILSNGTQTWSVQKKTALFFKKKTFDEIKSEYLNEIESLKSKLHETNKILRKYSKMIKQLTAENELLKKKTKKSSKK